MPSCTLSGHGGRVRDTSGDEDDGYDETLIPVDFKRAGQIVDDDIYKMLVTAMPAGVNVTVLVRGVFGYPSTITLLLHVYSMISMFWHSLMIILALTHFLSFKTNFALYMRLSLKMDCCHSGTALDLPYAINATQSQMHANDSFNFAGLLGDEAGVACCLCLGYLLASALLDG